MQSNRDAIFRHASSNIDTYHTNRRRPADTDADANFGVGFKIFVIGITDIGKDCAAETWSKLIVIFRAADCQDLSSGEIALLNR